MTIAAIYRNGVFEPLERVELAENKRVDIDVREHAEPSGTPKPKSLWELGGQRLLGLPGPDFKELGPEWKEYVE
jgi:Protein of unknown function DUF104